MKIIYEDRDILIACKEAGLAVQTKRPLEKDLESLIRAELYHRDGRAADLFLIHRIDQPVSGLVLFARSKKAAANLSAQLADGTMKKVYLARVSGKIPADEGTLSDWLIKDARTNTSRIVPEGTRGAKRAVLSYRKAGDDAVRIELGTGRHHQIRVQLSGAGMPIRGDVKYGGEPLREEKKAGICLTASELTFKHPRSGQVMTVKAPESVC